MFTVPLTRWVDFREPSRYSRHSAHLPEMGAAAERRVRRDMAALRRASRRANQHPERTD